jgi:putative SOS response-associated peptidase YedK
MIALLQSIHKPGRRLWDQWKDPETGEAISSATLIVTGANDFMRCIHDRMPVLLGQHDLDAWLTGKAGVELMRPAPNDLLCMWPVSKRVNVSGRGDNVSFQKSARSLTR